MKAYNAGSEIGCFYSLRGKFNRELEQNPPVIRDPGGTYRKIKIYFLRVQDISLAALHEYEVYAIV